jgi:TatD DNase family protein
MLVDSHCHLNYPGLVEELPEVLARAGEAGITHMVCICSRLSEFDDIRKIAEAHDHIFCTVGIHPHDSGNEPETDVQTLVELAQHPKVVGIGETGLDFFYDNSPQDIQERNFRTHIRAARETGLPLIVHTRDADEKTIEVLRDEFNTGGAFPGLIHCFSTGRAVADCALELGLYISLSGIVTFKNADDLRDVVKDLPHDRVLVETDSPFLAPIPHRGKRNEPAFVVHTATAVAELLGVPFSDLGALTNENFFRLFTKASA